MSDALSRAEVPVLLHTGWHDLIGEQVFESYDALRRRGVDVQLVVGPWNHGDLAGKAAGTLTRDSLGWLAEHLAGDGHRTADAAVRICVTGTDHWRELPAWPPSSDEYVLHLQPGGGLGPTPSADAGTATFTYDPTDPTPTAGGMTNARDAGRADNSAREQRPDVLTFTGPVLDAPLEVIGRPVLELGHASDNPHCDVFVRLCEVDAKGRSFNLSDGYVRLHDAADEQRRLELSAMAHVFRPGTRIRVQISGGSHPQHDRNLGTGEPPGTGFCAASLAAHARPGHLAPAAAGDVMSSMRLTAVALLLAGATACGSTVQVTETTAAQLSGSGLGGAVGTDATGPDPASDVGGEIVLPGGDVGTAAGRPGAPVTTGVGGSGSGSTSSGGGSTAGRTTTNPGQSGAPAGAGSTAAATVPSSGPGWDAKTVRIGVMTQQDVQKVAESFGVSSVDSGDQVADVTAITKELNRRGGLFGRTLVLDIYDIGSAGDPETQGQAACAHFTTDVRVVAVYAMALVGDTPSFRSCMLKAKLPVLAGGGQAFDDQVFAELQGYYGLMPFPSWSRFAGPFVDRLVAQQYYSGWDTTAGAPGAAPVKTGFLCPDTPIGRRVGALVRKESARVGHPLVRETYYAAGGGDASGYVLRFKADGITHVLFCDLGLFVFAQQAESQRYRPRYGVSTFNTPVLFLQGLVANAQLAGSVGVGWAPDPGRGPAARVDRASARDEGLPAARRPQRRHLRRQAAVRPGRALRQLRHPEADRRRGAGGRWPGRLVDPVRHRPRRSAVVLRGHVHQRPLTDRPRQPGGHPRPVLRPRLRVLPVSRSGAVHAVTGRALLVVRAQSGSRTSVRRSCPSGEAASTRPRAPAGSASSAASVAASGLWANSRRSWSSRHTR